MEGFFFEIFMFVVYGGSFLGFGVFIGEECQSKNFIFPFFLNTTLLDIF